MDHKPDMCSPRIIRLGERSPRIIRLGEHSPRIISLVEHSPWIISLGECSRWIIRLSEHAWWILSLGERVRGLEASVSAQSGGWVLKVDCKSGWARTQLMREGERVLGLWARVSTHSAYSEIVARVGIRRIMQLKGIIRLISQISRVRQASQKYAFGDDGVQF